MPVRIYDLAKKLGIESKEVLAKAKELGIASARVPSSSLDKITAEFLESQLAALYPPAPPPIAVPTPLEIPREPEPAPPAIPPPVEIKAQPPHAAPPPVEEPPVVVAPPSPAP